MIYSVDDPALPPALALATARELAEGAERSPAERYVPSEFSVFEAEPPELRDDGFREDCRVLEQEWRSREAEDEPRRLLVSVTKRVKAKDWASVLEPAPGWCLQSTTRWPTSSAASRQRGAERRTVV